MNASSRFAFAAGTLLSWAEVRRKVATDPRIPEKSRAGVLSSLSRFPEWVGQDASAIAFVEPVIEGLFRRLRADVLGVSSKRLQNARSDIRFVLGLMAAHAGIWRRSPRPRSGCGTCSVPSISGARCRGCCGSSQLRMSILRASLSRSRSDFSRL